LDFIFKLIKEKINYITKNKIREKIIKIDQIALYAIANNNEDLALTIFTELFIFRGLSEIFYEVVKKGYVKILYHICEIISGTGILIFMKLLIHQLKIKNILITKMYFI
jgi:hypothetical protein